MESRCAGRNSSEGNAMTTVEIASTRRQWIGRVIRFAGGAWVLSEAAVTPARAATSAEERSRFMTRALEMRKRAVERGDQPYGAVVVKETARWSAKG
jgi:K+ transporter